MHTYSKEVFDMVRNENYAYYKLFIDGKCAFDSFLQKVEKNMRDKKSLARIIGLMDSLGAHLLPRTQFNHINIPDSKDVYEFKKDALRVYILKEEREILVILGGYKTSQNKDIARVRRIMKDYGNNT